MELDNEQMKHRVDATLWLLNKKLGDLDEGQKEYLRTCLNRLVGSCLGIQKRDIDTSSNGGDAA